MPRAVALPEAMPLVDPYEAARPRPTLRIAAATLLIVALMNAGVGEFGRQVDAARTEQIGIAKLHEKAAEAITNLDRARLGERIAVSPGERNAIAAAMRNLARLEDRSTIVGLSEASDLTLAGIDLQRADLARGDLAQAAADARNAHAAYDRLKGELTALDLRCQARAEDGILALVSSVLAALLLSAGLVAYFAARLQRRTASVAALEVQTQSSEARERRFRLLLDIEQAAQDLADPDRVVGDAMRLLGGFLDARRCTYEAVDRGGQTVGGPLPEPQGLPRLGPQDYANLAAGRTRVAEALVRCPLMREGELCAVVSVEGKAGRDWSHDEIALIEEVTARCAAFAERAEAQTARRHSRHTSALLEAQLNSSPDGILIVDPRGNKILQNARMAEVWGIPADVIDDSDDARQLRLVGEAVADREAFIAGVQHLYAHPEKVQREEIVLKSGSTLERHTAPALGTDGTVHGRIWTFRDITDRIRAEQALREAHEELEARVEQRTRDLAEATQEAERANAAKSEFLSRMSHELRTPLNAILGFGQILQKQKLDTLQAESVTLQAESVHYILKGGRHLLGLINEVLDISRVETGHAELSIEPVPLAEVLVESFAMVRTMAADRHIVLEDDVDETADLHVVADRQRLKQVLINLLSNAVKYNRPGGRVTARCTADDGRVCLEIEDTGCGISPEGRLKLFTPFERLEAAATGVEGTGLGLFLTQKLVVTMGGGLDVRSVVGEGSTFILDFELARAPKDALLLVEGGAPPSEPEAGGERKVRILSIEDNSANVRLLQAILAEREDVELSTAGQGMAGFEMARQIEPDLILLDLNLPDVSGTEVLTRLKRSATTSAIPVIVISADASDAKVYGNLKAGAARFLTKPLDVDDFLRAVDDALRTETQGGRLTPWTPSKRRF